MPKVYYVPKKVAQAIRTPVHLISINDPYGSWAEFVVNHNRLSLGFINHYSGIQEHSLQHLIQEDQIQRIMDFVTPIMQKGEDIIVHCGEGSVRSPAIAQFINHMSEYMEGVPSYQPSGTYREHRGSDHHTCRHTARACVFYHTKKTMEGKTPITMEEAQKLCEEAGVEWKLLNATVAWYRAEEGRRFIKEDVTEALVKIIRGTNAASSLMMAWMRSAHDAKPELKQLPNLKEVYEHPEGKEFLKEATVVGLARIHPRDPDLKPIGESTVENIPDRTTLSGAMSHITMTGTRDESNCIGKGCDVCKKGK